MVVLTFLYSSLEQQKAMKYILLILFIIFLSCSSSSIEKTDTVQWITHHDTINAGFILTYRYPDNIVLADAIDNCRCVGDTITNDDKNQGTDSTNTRQWCICMQDTSDYSIDYFISSWKSIYKGQVTEKRDTILVGDTKALRVIFRNKATGSSGKQLIYLKKYSTLFEIINDDATTNKDFEIFYKSIKIEAYSKPENH